MLLQIIVSRAERKRGFEESNITCGSFEKLLHTWWRHQVETFSALLAICAGNSPVNGEFPAQRPVTRSFDVFFYLRLNKRLSKHSWGWWFETPSCSFWRQCNVGYGKDHTKVSPLRPGDAYMRQWTRSPLVRSLTNPLFGTKPSLASSLISSESYHSKLVSVKFQSQWSPFHLRKCNWKCCPINIGPFVAVSVF